MNIEITMNLFIARLVLSGIGLKIRSMRQTGKVIEELRAKAEELASVISLAEEELRLEEEAKIAQG